MPLQPYLGQICIVAFAQIPRGYLGCSGQLLPIQQNQALFALLGTFYGGNGTTNFGIPNFQGRTPIHSGVNNSGPYYQLGATGGAENVTLSIQNIPEHNHQITGTEIKAKVGGTANSTSPDGHYFANNTLETKRFTATPDTTGEADINTVIETSGGNISHSNMQPYLVLNFIIATAGIFPSRN